MEPAAEAPQAVWQQQPMEAHPDLQEEPPFQEVRAARRGRGGRGGRGAGRGAGRGVAPARGEGRGEGGRGEGGRGAGRGAGRGRGRGEARGGRGAGRGAGRGRAGRGEAAALPQPPPPVVVKKNCSVCWVELPVRRGVQCCEEEEANCHFVCAPCMGRMVTSYCAMDDDSIVIGKLREDSLDALIACPGYGCQRRFKNSRIIKALSPEAIESMQRAILLLTEKRVMRSFEQQMRERLRLEVTKYLNMDERTRALEEHKTNIIEQFLNLRCPRCQVAFVEFDGCLAVNCSSCNAGFCVCCLADCGTDAHEHVLQCEYNPNRGDYGSSGNADLNVIHKPRREQAVRDYLDGHVFEAGMREEIIKELTPLFADLNMDVAALSPVSKAG